MRSGSNFPCFYKTPSELIRTLRHASLDSAIGTELP